MKVLKFIFHLIVAMVAILGTFVVIVLIYDRITSRNTKKTITTSTPKSVTVTETETETGAGAEQPA